MITNMNILFTYHQTIHGNNPKNDTYKPYPQHGAAAITLLVV